MRWGTPKRPASPSAVPFILAEMDDLIGKMAGVSIELEFLAEVARQAYGLVPFTATDVEEARGVIESYSGLDVGLADASLVVLSRRQRVRDVLTLDERPLPAVAGRSRASLSPLSPRFSLTTGAPT